MIYSLLILLFFFSPLLTLLTLEFLFKLWKKKESEYGHEN